MRNAARWSLAGTAVALCAASPPAAPTGAAFDRAIAAAKSAMLIDPHAAVIKADIAARVARSGPAAQLDARLATAEWLQAEAYLRLNDPARAGAFITTAFGHIERDGPTKLKGDLLMSRGGYDSAIGAGAKALRDYQAAHNIFRRIGDNRSRAIALINLGVLYQQASDPDTALRYFAESREASSSDASLAYASLNNSAQVLKDLGRFREAADKTRAALALARHLGSPVLALQILRNLARIELALNDLPRADRDLAEAFRLADGLPKDDEYRLLVNTAAQAALQHGRIAEAVELVDRSFAGVDIDHTTVAFRTRHQTAYDIYRRAGDTAGALQHLAALKRLDDEATKLATSASAALMGARFDFANQEARIAKLRADEAQRNLAFAQARAATQQTIFFDAGGATLIVIVLLGFGLLTVRRSRNEVRQANVVLGDTNAALGKALAAKTEFLATTSHEIRTPLNGILGMTQVMLAEGSLDAATSDRVRLVHGAGVTMRALVDDILDVAKIESGNLTVELAPVDVCAVLSDMTRLAGEQARAKGLIFDVELSGCPKLVSGDAARLRQIVANLLSNAIKFTTAGTVRLATDVAPDGKTYAIRVSDTGVGIDEDKLGIIFESFRQADTSTTRRFGGTGLGLSICRSLAQAMHGEVSVASTPGGGSCFTLTLPLIQVDAPEVEAPTGEGFLIVERNPIVRAMLKAMVSSHAGHVLLAGSLAEALAHKATTNVMHVLADDAALRMSGDLADGVRRLKDGVRTLTLLWAPGDDESQFELSAAGVNRFITKPIARSALAAELSINLDYHQQHLVPQAA